MNASPDPFDTEACADALARQLADGDRDGAHGLIGSLIGAGRPAVRVGRALLRRGQHEAARQLLDALFQKDSHVRDAAQLWGQACLGTGRIEEALEAFALAAAEYAEQAEGSQRLARLLIDLGRWHEAVPWLCRWLELAPDAAEAKAWLARALDLRRPPPSGLADCDPRLADALYRAPILAAQPFEDLQISALTGGNLNIVYRVTGRLGDFAVRLGKYPRQRWDAYWDERANHRAAHATGLAPEPLFFDIADGTLVTRFVEGRIGGRMARPAFLAKAAEFFNRLHAGPAFRGTFDPLVALDWREERVQGLVPDWVPDLPRLRAGMAEVRAVLDATAPAPAPCHNDPIIGNFIDGAGGLVMVDWQTAAMADPDAEIGAFLARIAREGDLRDGFLAASYGHLDHPRAHRARLWECMARYVEIVEAVQMGVDEPEDEGWIDHGKLALDTVRILHDDGTVTRGVAALKG